MDELDQNILDELQKQGFQKSRTLAHLLGVGERTVHRRITTMRREGIVKVVAVPDFISFGYAAWAKIGIKVEPNSLPYVARQLVDNPSIYFVAYSYGRFDILIAVRFGDFSCLTYFVDSELSKIRGILSTETLVFASPRKYYNFSWPKPLFKRAGDEWQSCLDTSTSHNHYLVDEVDRRIISILMEDGLARPAAIRAKLGVSESTIRKHMKKMLSNGMFRIVVVPNPELLKDAVWATMGINISNRPGHEILDDIVKHPEVYLASVSIGRFNLVIAAHFHSIDFLHRFVTVELPAIQGVGHVETFLHNKPLKYHNIKWSI